MFYTILYFFGTADGPMIMEEEYDAAEGKYYPQSRYSFCRAMHIYYSNIWRFRELGLDEPIETKLDASCIAYSAYFHWN